MAEGGGEILTRLRVDLSDLDAAAAKVKEVFGNLMPGGQNLGNFGGLVETMGQLTAAIHGLNTEMSSTKASPLKRELTEIEAQAKRTAEALASSIARYQSDFQAGGKQYAVARKQMAEAVDAHTAAVEKYNAAAAKYALKTPGENGEVQLSKSKRAMAEYIPLLNQVREAEENLARSRNQVRRYAPAEVNKGIPYTGTLMRDIANRSLGVTSANERVTQDKLERERRGREQQAYREKMQPIWESANGGQAGYEQTFAPIFEKQDQQVRAAAQKRLAAQQKQMDDIAKSFIREENLQRAAAERDSNAGLRLAPSNTLIDTGPTIRDAGKQAATVKKQADKLDEDLDKWWAQEVQSYATQGEKSLLAQVGRSNSKLIDTDKTVNDALRQAQAFNLDKTGTDLGKTSRTRASKAVSPEDLTAVQYYRTAINQLVDQGLREFMAAQNMSATDVMKFAIEAKKAGVGLGELRQQIRGLVQEAGGLSKLGPLLGVASNQMHEFETATEQAIGKVKAVPTMFDRIIGSTSKALLVAGEYMLVWQGVSKVIEGIGHGIEQVKESEVQGVLFKAGQRGAKDSGVNIDTSTSNDLIQQSSVLAIHWGDNINDVTQDVSLWYKQLGDLNAALSMTNQELEFQVATGTDLEDTYRTLLAVSQQAKGIKFDTGDKETFNLTRTHDLLTAIFAAANAAGAGMRQENAEGAELHSGMANSAGILLKAIEQDVDSLGNLKLSMKEIIALNQSMITAMGGTGSEANDTANKISRLVGGIMKLSSSSEAKSLSKNLGPDVFSAFQNVINSSGSKDQGDVVKSFANFYELLEAKSKNVLAYSVSGTRQYQTMANMVKQVADALGLSKDQAAKFASEYDKITKAMKDQKILDDTASEMMGTFKMQVNRVTAEWDAMVVVIGQRLLPVIERAMDYLIHGIPNALNMLSKSEDVAPQIDSIAARYGKKTDRSLQNTLPFNTTQSDEMLRNSVQEFVNRNTVRKSGTPGMSAVESFLSKNIHTADPSAVEAARKWLGDLNTPHSGSAQDDIRSLSSVMIGGKGPAAGLNLLQAVAGKNDPVNYTLSAAAGQIQAGMSDFKKLASAKYGSKQAQDALKNFNGGDNEGQTGAAIADPSGGGASDALKDYQLFGDQMDFFKQKTLEASEAMAELRKGDDGAVSAAENHIKVLGVSTDTLNELSSALHEKMVDDNRDIEQTKARIAVYERFAAVAKSHAMDSKGNAINTKDARGWLEQYNAAMSEVRSSRTHLSEVTGDEAGIPDKYNRYSNELAEKNLSRIQKAGSTQQKLDSDKIETDVNIPQKLQDLWKKAADEQKNYQEQFRALASITGFAEFTDKLNQITDAHKEATAAIKEEITKTEQLLGLKAQDEARKEVRSWTDKQFEPLQQMAAGAAPTPAAQAKAAYLKEVVSLTAEAADEQAHYNEEVLKYAGDDTMMAQVNGAHQAADEFFNLSLAAAGFKEQLDTIQSSLWYKSVENGLDAVADALSKSILDNMFGEDDAQQYVQQIQDEINILDAKRNMLNQVYDLERTHSPLESANHALFMYEQQQEVKVLEDKKKAEEYAAQHPPILKKIAEDITKNFLDGTLKQLENSLLGSIAKDPNQKAAQDALNTFSDAVTHSLVSTVGDWKTTNSDLMPVLKDLTQTLKDAYGVDGGTGPETGWNAGGGAKTLAGSGAMTAVGSPAVPNLGGFMPTPGASSASTTAAVLAMMGISGADLAQTAASSMPNPNIAYQQGQYDPSQDPNNPAYFGISDDMADAWLSAPSSNQSGLQAFANNLFGSGLGSMGAQGLGQILSLAGAATSKSPIGTDLSTASALLGQGIGGIGAAQAQAALPPILGGSGSIWGNAGADVAGGLGALGSIVSSFSTSQDSGWGSILGAGIGAIGGPLGMEIGSSLGGMVGSLFGPHYSPTTNPDMYANDGFAQALANAMGVSGTAANGTTWENPELQQGLGGLTEIQYLDQFVSEHPGGQGLTNESLQLWKQANAMTGGGTATQLVGTGQGNFEFANASGGGVGTYGSQNWQQLLSTIQNTTQSILAFNSALNTAAQAFVVFNAYGTGGNFGAFPYAWNTPGYEFPNSAYPGPSTSKPGSTTNNSTGTVSGSVGSGSNPYNVPVSKLNGGLGGASGSIVLPVTLNVDGRTLARVIQSYTLQTNAAGYTNIS